MNNINYFWASDLEKIPLKKGIKLATVKQVLEKMAGFSNMDTSLFHLSIGMLARKTGLSKDVIPKTREWIEQLGLIKDTGGRINGCIVYKFICKIEMSSEAAILNAHYENNRVSPRENIKHLKIAQPEQQTLLPENSDSSLPENSDSSLPENSDTIEYPRKLKKTSCEIQTKKTQISLTSSNPTKENSFEEGEGFIFLKSLLKRCKQIDTLERLSKKHSLHSIQCYHQELKNDIAKGTAKTIGALVSRLESGDEWSGAKPLVVRDGGGKSSNQTVLNLMSVGERIDSESKKAADKLNLANESDLASSSDLSSWAQEAKKRFG